MTRAFTLTLCALAAALLGLVALSGCGNDVPAGAVAKVGDSTITQDEFDKWMGIAVKGQSQSAGGAAAVPKPPDFEACVAAKKKTPVPKGQQKPSDDALKKQCKSEYDTLKREVMQFLIQGEWVQQEAQKRGVKVKDAELQKALEDQKKQVFPNDKQYQQFLKTSGMTEEDVLFRVKLNELQQRLTQKVTQDAKNVSRRRHLSVLREEQEAVRPAGAPRPARRADEDAGQGGAGQEGARRPASPSSRS